jgi:hypothetical protein
MTVEHRPVIGLDPTSGPLLVRDDRQPAPRPVSLDGAVVGLVANGLGESRAFLTAVFEALSESIELSGAVPVLKPSVSVPPEPDDWARLTSEATVAITGFGG